MPRDPRYIPPNSLQHVVDTTFQNRFLLTPSRLLNERFLGVLGKAQKVHEMTICAVVAASSHHHLLLRPRDGQHLANFMCFLKTNLAKELGSRLHGWKGHFFAGRFRAIHVSDEALAQLRVLRYILSHGPKENLVDTVREWPGVHSAAALIDGQPLIGRWYDRTAEYEARSSHGKADPEDFACQQQVTLSPLPCWQELPEAEWRRAVEDLVNDIDRQAAVARAASGKPSLGVRKVLSMDPHHCPDTSLETPGTSPKPRFHALDSEDLSRLFEAWQAVITAFRKASDKLRGGDPEAEFPEGTFPPALPFVPFTDPSSTARGQPA